MFCFTYYTYFTKYYYYILYKIKGIYFKLLEKFYIFIEIESRNLLNNHHITNQSRIMSLMTLKILCLIYDSQFLDLAVRKVNPSPLKASNGSDGVSSFALGGLEFLINLSVPRTKS